MSRATYQEAQRRFVYVIDLERKIATLEKDVRALADIAIQAGIEGPKYTRHDVGPRAWNGLRALSPHAVAAAADPLARGQALKAALIARKAQ